MADGAQPAVARPDVARPDVAQLLETLHPLREPPPPASALPYLAMLGLGLALALLVALALRQRRSGRRAGTRAALAALAASRGLAPPERLAAQAALLRRLVRAGGGEARGQGPAWLAALDRAFATTFFTRGEGQQFGDALYRRPAAADPDAVDAALAALIGGAGPRKVPRRVRPR